MPRRIKVKENTLKSTEAYSNMEGILIRYFNEEDIKNFNDNEVVVRIDKKYEEQLTEYNWVIEPVIDLCNIIFLSDIQMEIE